MERLYQIPLLFLKICAILRHREPFVRYLIHINCPQIVTFGGNYA